MRFIDATIITLAFTPNDKRERCRDVLREGGLTNCLVLMESFNCIERITKNRRLATDTIRSLLGNLEVVPISDNLVFEALRRTEKYNLKIYDLVHYITALLRGCSSFVSYDSDFDGFEIKREEP